MVKILIDRPRAEIAFAGNPVLVAAELASAVSGMYQGLTQKDPVDAAAFKACMQEFFEDDSPTWNAAHNMTMVTIPVNKKGGTPTDQS